MLASSAAQQGRVLPADMRPRSREVALIGDYAGGGPVMSASALDGVFCFLEEEEVSFKRAEAAKSSEDERVKVLGQLKAADAHVEQGRLKEAAQEVEKANAIIQELRFQEGRALAMTLVAKVYAKQGKLSTPDQLDEALDLAEEAQEKFRKFGAKKCEAAAWLALAAARHAVKKFDLGMEAAREAEKLLVAVGDKSAEAQVHYIVAEGFALKGEGGKAAKAMQKARAIHQGLGDKKGEALDVLKVGRLAIEGNDKDAAVSALAEARTLFQAQADVNGEIRVLRALRDFQLKRGQVAETVDVCKEIVTAYHDAHDFKGEGNALLDLAEMLMDKGHVQLADSTSRAAHKVFSSVRDPGGLLRVSEVNARLKNETLKHDIKQSIYDNRDYAHYPDEPYIELGLSRVATDAYNEVAKKGL